MKIQVLLVLACFCLANADDHYCGRDLSRALRDLCPYLSSGMVKRSPQHAFQPSGTLEQWKPDFWPWLVQAPQVLHGNRRKRQVVSECCDKSCSIDELLTYCP
ncbi:bombyxin-related peptide B-like [Leguminivora glycinivorella]|uniref:bombyxin-related peptide B-like n=1 Tax=Leguminivora glycinivorella TaxID=1035111 RepID=UPI00200D954F|nr:bombyxin-related peptide B-like [Leguminivora glycinivorella]